MEEYVVMLRSKGFKTEKEASACFDLIDDLQSRDER